MPYAIRIGLPTDIAAVHALLLQTWHATYDSLIGAERVTAISEAWHDPETLAAETAEAGLVFLIAEDESGVIVAHMLADLHSAGLITVRRLYVHPSCQRQGIGTRLMDQLAFCGRGSLPIELEVAAHNDGALAFYQKRGFSTVSSELDDGILILQMACPADGPQRP